MDPLAAGYWLLATGYWLLVTGCWLLVAGCWLLDAGCWLLVTGCWFQSPGYRELEAGIRTIGCWLLAVLDHWLSGTPGASMKDYECDHGCDVWLKSLRDLSNAVPTQMINVWLNVWLKDVTLRRKRDGLLPRLSVTNSYRKMVQDPV